MHIRKILLGTVAAAAMSVSAHAAPLLGTFPGSISVTAPGVDITTLTPLTLVAGGATGPGTRDLSGVTSFVTTISGVTTPFTPSNGSPFAFTLDGFGTFSSPGISRATLVVNSATSRALSFFALGTFTPTLAGFDPGPASITGGFTQDGGRDGSVSLSFTFSSPPSPPPGVPAPAALALFGVALAGLGFAARARKAG